MAQFLKDLVHYNKGFFQFDALFGVEDIKIRDKSYKYNELAVEFLNFDFTEFKQAMTENSSFEEKNKAALRLPLYKDFYYEDVSSLAEMFKNEEFSPLFDNHKIDTSDFDLILESINLIEKYRWFLEEVNVNKEKNFINQINMNGMASYVSDKTLRTSSAWEATSQKVQYVLVEDENESAQIFEQITFANLMDFFYTDFYKGIMKESIPKKCKLCGKYFLLEKGFNYEYCNNIYEDNKTCRAVGSTKSFKTKTASNDIWKIHQRAYKKYYARVLKKKMDKDDFLYWSLEAEEIRDDYLPIYEKAIARGKEFDLDEYTKKINFVD